MSRSSLTEQGDIAQNCSSNDLFVPVNDEIYSRVDDGCAVGNIGQLLDPV